MADLCNACQKPFEEVHPFDFMNDWTCYEMNKDYPKDPAGVLDRRVCRMNHTWREHVQASYARTGQIWINPHYRVADRSTDKPAGSPAQEEK